MNKVKKKKTFFNQASCKKKMVVGITDYKVGRSAKLLRQLNTLKYSSICRRYDRQEQCVIFNNWVDQNDRSGDCLRTQVSLELRGMTRYARLLQTALRDARDRHMVSEHHTLLLPHMLCAHPGCGQQKFHRDLTTECTEKETVVPLSLLVPLMDNSKLETPDRTIHLQRGDYVVFGARMVHAGAANPSTDTMNLRLHAYVGRHDLVIGDQTDDQTDDQIDEMDNQVHEILEPMKT